MDAQRQKAKDRDPRAALASGKSSNSSPKKSSASVSPKQLDSPPKSPNPNEYEFSPTN